jgi:MoaA/NifB/PqqE/SkfB family radical SAM enzyme
MIGIAWKIPFFILSRQLGWPKMLPINLTVTPSPRCNSRCKTCNIWQRRDEELTLDEWDRVFASLGQAPFWFTISGGEPFLYHDIVSLCQSAYERCRPGIINIPTNCLLHTVIPGKVEEICRACPDTQIIVNLSLDGVGEKHDQIRGAPGNFERFEQTLHALRAIDRPNLAVGVHSVISRFNVDDLHELLDYALAAGSDSYITEIAEQRVELGTVGLDITPSAEAYSRAIDQITQRVGQTRFGGISRVTEAFRLEYYKLVKRILVEKKQIIPCFAGWASAHIYSNGDVWACCVRAESLGNLRGAGLDFGRVWSSPEADRMRTSIANKDCHCPLANAGYTNMLMHVPTLLRVGTKVSAQTILAARGGVSRPLAREDSSPRCTRRA